VNGIQVLLVEDERSQRILLKRILEKEGYLVEDSENGGEALALFERRDFDLVLLDQRLPDIAGIEVLRRIRIADPMVPVIVVTAYANVHDAVQAMKEGAFHYLTKPIDPEELLLVMKKAVEALTLKRENEELRRSLRERYRYESIVYASGRMEEVMALAYGASRSDANVLVTGESGTGKELVAGAIHSTSGRKERNFVIAHLAALPETLIEAELFGHEKGAFTGASTKRIGKFEFASGGTIFLDEIGELSRSVQIRLLRVIQEKKVVRLGSNEEIPVDLRLICATNKNLEEEVGRQNFREDLYYRLNVIRIHVPPLRERKEDIPLLVDHFIRLYSDRENRPVQGITKEALKSLMRYNFPGNIRELGNMVERAIVFARSDYITREDLPIPFEQRAGRRVSGGLRTTVEKVEKEMIVDALGRNKWNNVKTAIELGVSERVLRYKMKKYNLQKQHS
jgi:two-component system NtrC family response regulator